MMMPIVVLAAAILQVSTGLLRDGNGVAVVDPVLLLVLAAAQVEGRWRGLLCACLGGLACGLPGHRVIVTSLLYSSAVLVRGPLDAAMCGAGCTLLLAGWVAWPAALSNALLAALLTLLLRRRRA